VGELNYSIFNTIFETLGLKPNKIPIDKDGIVVDAHRRNLWENAKGGVPLKVIYLT